MGSGQKRATIKDVAQMSGVSVASVSRVLSGKYTVGANTRARVMQAVKELDFIVNVHARALNSEGPGAIAMIVRSVTTQFLAHVAQGVEEQAAAENQLCMVCTTQGDPDREIAIIDRMREQRARAVILVGGVVSTEEYVSRMTQIAHTLDAAGSRLVLVGRPAPAPDLPISVVAYDNEGGAYAITSFLLSAGHRRVLMLGGFEDHTTAAGRRRGYERALKDWGVEVDPALHSYGPMTRTYGHDRMRELLAAKRRDFTAVFAMNDLVAAGVLVACREAGVRVPQDLSVAGYDDTPLAADLVPALTTVRVPQEEMGRLAVRRALHPELVAGDAGLLGTHVVVRESVAPPQR